MEYRISDDGTDWGEWQTSNVFEGLNPGTGYQIQARYIPGGEIAYYEASAASEAISVTTEENKPYINITVGEASGKPGETIMVPVTLDTDFDKRAYTPNYTFTAAENAPFTVGTSTRLSTVASKMMILMILFMAFSFLFLYKII